METLYIFIIFLTKFNQRLEGLACLADKFISVVVDYRLCEFLIN